MGNDLARVGNHLIIGLPGTSLSKAEALLLSELSPSGIILFAHNIAAEQSDWPERLVSLISQACCASGRDDLLVAIDHEGGRVNRFPQPVTSFPPARDCRHRAEEVASAMASELRALSFNLSFAPVLDVNSEPDNQVIGKRSFAENPEEAASFALSFAARLEASGILSCGKHFPGHGATRADSHFELPVLHAPLKTILERDVLPFRHYIEWGAQLIMTAHVLYPALDPLHPATFSERIVTGLLRGELGFGGVVVSDDLEMAAARTLPIAQRAVTALRAGVDLLLEGNPKDGEVLQKGREMAKGILQGLREGKLSEEKLEQSAERIKRLRAYSKGLLAGSANTSCPLSCLGCEAHRRLAQQLA